jgi:hypothetical protein
MVTRRGAQNGAAPRKRRRSGPKTQRQEFLTCLSEETLDLCCITLRDNLLTKLKARYI